jgi:NAD(P)-dependent dehydrogenase (short-subunit alcohol dehydrogenase family)
MDNISGKTIAITGAARGIGFATAKALLARGARVVIGDRDVALQESAVAGLGKLGQVSGYPLDVTDRDSFETFLDKARTDGGGHIDVLINNAGVMPIGPFLEQSEQSIRSAIEVNLYGVLTGCQLALPDMVARRRGHIINIASLSGLIPVPGQVVYVGAKFGVVGLSAALADEMAPHGVDVSVVMPPFTNTELISGTKSSGAIKPVEPEDHRRRSHQDAGEAQDTRVGAAAAAVHRAGRADAGPARKALAQQAFGAGQRVPGLRRRQAA